MFRPASCRVWLSGGLSALAAGTVLAGPVGPVLPPPDPTHDVKVYGQVIGWPEGRMPAAPDGFVVSRFAAGLQSPRWIHVTPNGDVLVAEANTEPSAQALDEAKRTGKVHSQRLGPSANRITLFRDTDGDGQPDLRSTFLDGLKQPLGMQVMGDGFYVANTDSLWRYPYRTGDQKLHGAGEKLLDLPAGGYNNHWTRNLLASPDNRKLYIAVGSASDHAEYGLEEEQRRAAILEVNPDGSEERLYATGLRNPVGMDWAPGSRTLWAVVNERDGLGDALVPDYLTAVRDGGFYGWPFAYFGAHEDPRLRGQRPDLVAKAMVPDLALTAHGAALGLTFYTERQFPERYQGGAFIGQHGSWNRRELVGYQVVFVPFRDGRPSGPPEPFLTGFIADPARQQVHGRPVGVAVNRAGALLVADDASGVIWQVSAKEEPHGR